MEQKKKKTSIRNGRHCFFFLSHLNRFFFSVETKSFSFLTKKYILKKRKKKHGEVEEKVERKKKKKIHIKF